MATRIGAFAYLECSARTKEGVRQVIDDGDLYYGLMMMVVLLLFDDYDEYDDEYMILLIK